MVWPRYEALLRDSVRTHFLTLARQLATAKNKMPQEAGVAIEKALALSSPLEQAQALCAALLIASTTEST